MILDLISEKLRITCAFLTIRVIGLFNTKYRDSPITQSEMRKVDRKFRDTVSVDDVPKAGRSKINEEITVKTTH